MCVQWDATCDTNYQCRINSIALRKLEKNFTLEPSDYLYLYLVYLFIRNSILFDAGDHLKMLLGHQYVSSHPL